MLEKLPVKNADHKNQVVAAYHELLNKLKDTKKNAKSEDTVFEKEQERFVEIVTNETPEESVNHFENLKHSLIEGVAKIQESFLAEQKKLNKLVQTIENKHKEIAHLHDIEINIDTLSALLLAQKEKTASFEKEIQQRKQAFDYEMEQKRKEWQQEEQKYLYQRDLGREKDRNQYEIAKRNLAQELSSMRFEFQKEVKEREARIASGEQALDELEQLQAKVAQFPEEIQKAMHKAEEATTKQLSLKFDYETQLLQKEIELQQQTIAKLETKIALLETNIAHFESLKNSFNRISFNSMGDANGESDGLM